MRRSRRLREPPVLRAAAAPGGNPRPDPDWAGLPEDLLVKVAGKLVAQTEAGWAAWLKEGNPDYWTEERLQEQMATRERVGNCCLFVFARVCKQWRKAQLEVGGRLRTRMRSDVIGPGSVALVKWALAEGCPREDEYETIAEAAARYGHLELVKWLCGEGGFAMNEAVMAKAARSGNLELVQFLRGEGCPWDTWTIPAEILRGDPLRWIR